MSGVANVTLDVLLDAALNGRPYNQQRLGLEASRYARQVSNALARSLPDDLHEDVFHEAFANLLEAGPAAIIGTTCRKAFRNALVAAIRTTRSNYTPPGQRTRSPPVTTSSRVAAEDIDRIPSPAELKSAAIIEGEHRSIDLDQFPSTIAAAALLAVETRIDVGAILKSAPAPIADALRLIYFNDLPIEVASVAVNLSRFALHRRIERFCGPLRMVA